MKPRINIGIDWTSKKGPGYDRMGENLPTSFLAGDPNHVCATIAFMCMEPEPERVKRRPQALAMLALYAAETAITLTRDQFRRLTRDVQRYMLEVGDVDYAGTKNHVFAKFVLERAVQRAQREVIIGFGTATAAPCQCPHVCVQEGESVMCSQCDEDLGWFCPESPDHACHYFTEGGLVVLVSGRTEQPPPEHDVTGETEDACIFCGLPEERK